MKKRFNSTGVCVRRKHYMVDISNKLKKIRELIDNEFYFTINKPRQYGKTTTLNELKMLLKEEYLVISISFEGIGDKVFENEEVNTLFESIVKNLENNKELYELTQRMIIDGEQIDFNPLNPTISIGVTYGVFKKGENVLEISNKIFEEIIYNYMISKIRTSAKNMSLYNVKSSLIQENGELNMGDYCS